MASRKRILSELEDIKKNSKEEYEKNRRSFVARVKMLHIEERASERKISQLKPPLL